MIGDLRGALLAAMAMARLDEATDYLVGLVGDASTQTATEIVKALSAYHRDERVREALKRAVESRGGEIQRSFEEIWR